MSTAKNVLGSRLVDCSHDPLTGFTRTGCCENGPDDPGLHLVCVRVTKEFLAFSVRRGNDLVTPKREWSFPGLTPGDQWCLCVERWREAWEAKVAPPVVLEATHISVLEFIDLEVLQSHAAELTR